MGRLGACPSGRPRSACGLGAEASVSHGCGEPVQSVPGAPQPVMPTPLRGGGKRGCENGRAHPPRSDGPPRTKRWRLVCPGRVPDTPSCLPSSVLCPAGAHPRTG
eukprot:scaffold1282_cov105-Isochrysis_galbana.AAC.2